MCSSSSFEAATKFGFILSHFHLISSSTTLNVEVICECEESGEILVYLATEGDDKTQRLTLKCIQKGEKEILIEDSVDPLENSHPQARSLRTSSMEMNTSEDLVQSTLMSFFKHQSFKSHQKEVIMATMEGRNVLGVLGTGVGKSLTFMLPAVLANKPTIVVIPTKSLIDDLLIRCSALNIKASKISGDVPLEVRDSVLNELSTIKLLFITPEMFANNNFLDRIMSVGLERIVFDEAHTICTWGNTFRPQYRSASDTLAKYPCPKLLLSATVPQQHILELGEILGSLDVIKDQCSGTICFLKF